MATTQQPDNSIFTTMDPAIKPKADESLIIDPGIFIASQMSNGIEGTDQRNSATVNGAVGGSIGASFLDLIKLTVGTSGTVSGTMIGLGAGDGSVRGIIQNNGHIFGGGIGAFLGGKVTLTNTGTIQAGTGNFNDLNAAVVLTKTGKLSGATVINSGTIATKLAAGFAIASGGNNNAADKVTNTGTILGKVALGDGNDTYDGRLGHVSGQVRGDTGNDTLLGGTENNTLVGGAGLDTLLGGKGNDAFTFDAALSASNLDHIRDFANASGNNDLFRLDDAVFAALHGVDGAAAGKLDPAQFKDLSLAKADADDCLLYNPAKGTLFYDGDGAAGGQPVLFAILDNHAKLTAADFIVV